MTTLPIILRSGNLPLNYEGSAHAFFRDFVCRLDGDIQDSNLVLGSMSATEPRYNVGPWLRGTYWFMWNETTIDYEPEVYIIQGTNGSVLTLRAKPTANRIQIVPGDSNDFIALMVDVFVPRTNIALSGLAPSMDWSASNDFIIRLSGNTVMAMSDSAEGEVTHLITQNNGTGYTLTLPGYVQWPAGGAQPAQPVSTSAGHVATGSWVFRRVGATIYGELEGAGSVSPETQYDPGGPDDVPDSYVTPAGPSIPIHNLP